jgi:hypothetical protein
VGEACGEGDPEHIDAKKCEENALNQQFLTVELRESALVQCVFHAQIVVDKHERQQHNHKPIRAQIDPIPQLVVRLTVA